jgi:hypothetical protein
MRAHGIYLGLLHLLLLLLVLLPWVVLLLWLLRLVGRGVVEGAVEGGGGGHEPGPVW